MGLLMDLVAGDTREILLAIAVDDWDGLRDRTRFDAHLPLGGGLEPVWLDRFADAARSVPGGGRPAAFTASCRELDGPSFGERTVERVDRAWIEAVAAIPDHRIDAVAARWIDLLDGTVGELLAPEEKTWIRRLAADLVAFARAALDAPDILFAWSP